MGAAPRNTVTADPEPDVVRPSAPPFQSGLPSPLQAVDEMRSLAKWTIGATAAVGVALVGAGPLAAVGKIDGWVPGLLAFAGLIMALAGVAWSIWRTAEALTPLDTIGDQDPPEKLGEFINNHKVFFYGPFTDERLDHKTLPDARRLWLRRAQAWAQLLERAEDEVDRRALGRAHADAVANAQLAHRLAEQRVAFEHAWKVRHELHRARVHTFAAFAVVALGAVLFLAATSVSDSKPKTPAPRPSSSVPGA